MTKKATNRRIRADELFVMSLSKMCPDLRRQVLEGKIKLQKTQIKKLGNVLKSKTVPSILLLKY
jgi:hypothetical protein